MESLLKQPIITLLTCSLFLLFYPTRKLSSVFQKIRYLWYTSTSYNLIKSNFQETKDTPLFIYYLSISSTLYTS